MKLAIIGAGVAGLVSLKYALESGHECYAFEQSEQLGGTWVYTDKFGANEYGFPIRRTMYKGLKTNIPKEQMEFLDFQYSSEIDESFISQPEVLQYLRDFSTKFHLEKHIQYHKSVTKVTPSHNKWIVTVLDVKTKMEQTSCYDAVFVCNGHFFQPRIPQLEGQNVYKGLQMHSCDYRYPDLYKDQRVLIVGAAFSAVDIANQISQVTKHIYLSHWKPCNTNTPNITIKPSIKQFSELGVTFSDESKEDFDIVIYCTGYEYSFPFLSEDCGITVEDNWVRYLYKHIINIEKPGLCFIGIPFQVCPFPTCDMQARFALAVIEEKCILPAKQQMMKELHHHYDKLKEKNIPQRYFHCLGIAQGEYLEDLSKTANIRSIPPVISNIHTRRIMAWQKLERLSVRKYIIIDDDQFIEIT